MLKEPDTSLIKQVYLMLKEDTDYNCNYNGKKWASQIRQLLQEHGFDYVWQLQAVETTHTWIGPFMVNKPLLLCPGNTRFSLGIW